MLKASSPARVVFFGTPQIAADCLQALLDTSSFNVVAVVTKPDKPKGRSKTPMPSEVKQLALAHDLPLYQPEKVSDLENAPLLQSFGADLFVVVAYGEILKQHLLDMPKVACINLHASLLPAYRGAAPIQRCLIAGETESGITVMHMVRQMDAGDMVCSVKTAIPENMTAGELTKTLSAIGSKALVASLQDLLNGTAARVPQDHSKATLAPKVELEECHIHWTLPAKQLHNLIRGTNPEPGAFCFIRVKGEQKRLRILRSEVIHESFSKPGTLVRADKPGPVISCGQEAIRLLEVQPEGKNPMRAADWLRGIPQDALSFE